MRLSFFESKSLFSRSSHCSLAFHFVSIAQNQQTVSLRPLLSLRLSLKRSLTRPLPTRHLTLTRTLSLSLKFSPLSITDCEGPSKDFAVQTPHSVGPVCFFLGFSVYAFDGLGV